MLSLALLALLSSVAPPSPPSPPSPRSDQLEDGWRGYHDGEFAGAALVVGAGSAFAVAGVTMLIIDDDFVRSLGGTLAVGGALAAAGFVAWLVVIPGRVDEGVAALGEDEAAFVVGERSRMDSVIARFTPLRMVTGALTAAGLAATGIGKGIDNDVVAGIGLGTAAVAFTVFVYDSAAAERGRVWRATLE